MNDITQLTQVRRMRAVLCNDDELKATFELMIVLCNILLKSDNDELLQIIEDELRSEMCSE
tara:strand:- start:59 stop:241 length:183 start_codon:yes stop_codon:yes gene_type:complete